MFGRFKGALNATLRQAALPLVTLVIGVMAFAVAITATIFADGKVSTLATTAFWVAQTLIGAGIVVGVMRALQSADYFEDGLRRILFDVDDPLPEGPIDYEKSWKRLTTSLIRRRFSDVDDQVNDIDYTSLMGDANYYYKTHTRTIDIKWSDKKNSMIEIIDFVDAVLKTADAGKMITFENWFKPEAGSTSRTSISCKFSGAITKTLTDSDMIEMNGLHGFQIELPPNSTIKLKRTFAKSQDLRADPLLNYVSLSMLNRPRVNISCPRDLRFYFRKTGLRGEFEADGGVEIDSPLQYLAARYEGLCLRNQGYMIVIVRA